MELVGKPICPIDKSLLCCLNDPYQSSMGIFVPLLEIINFDDITKKNVNL